MPIDQTERNRQLALRWFAAMNAGDLGVVDELFAPDYRLHLTGGPEDARGPAVIRGVIEGYLAAFPDLHFTVHETVAAGDVVCVRWTAEGTHRGPLLGVEPSGARARWTGISWLRFADGKVAEDWVENDVFGMMQQLAPAAVV
ncbi:MAG TPA: ester cyclase [Longimicrobium sp.]